MLRSALLFAFIVSLPTLASAQLPTPLDSGSVPTTPGIGAPSGLQPPIGLPATITPPDRYPAPLGGLPGTTGLPGSPGDASNAIPPLTEPPVDSANAVGLMLENRADTPFEYKLRTAHGKFWSDQFELAASEKIKYTAPETEDEDLAMLRNFGAPGHLLIRFPVEGGWITYKLVAGKHYVHVIADGMSEIVEARPTGPLVYTQMKREKRLQQLKDNHCFTPTPKDAT